MLWYKNKSYLQLQKIRVSGNREQINVEKVLVLCFLITDIIIHLFFFLANRASTVYTRKYLTII